MKKTIFTLTASTLALLTMGCQPKTKTKVVEVPKKDKVYNFTKESYGDPVAVPTFDSSCNSQRGLGLRNTIIKEAYMGVETVSTRTIIEEDLFVNAREKDITRVTLENDVINQGRPVMLCRDASTIPVNTVEGAAISMKADVDQAYALYQSVKSSASIALPTLQAVYLSAAHLQKQIERHVDKDEDATEVTEYMTDNAVFMGGESPTLISFPQSEVARKLKLLGGVPLWNVKGVFQHEFGHFVFASVMNEGGSSFTSYQDYAAANPELHLFHTPASHFARIAESPALKAGFTKFLRTQDFFIGSLNEGFADLWAYYTLKQPTDMFNISCFAKNRNVADASFYNGVSKSWDEALWNKTFNGEVETDSNAYSNDAVEACSQPIFSDIHIIGAAMAHTADAVFSTAAQTHGAGSNPSLLKAEMSVAWLKAIKDSAEFEDLGGKASLSRILNTAVGTGINYLQGTDKTAFCAVVSSKFPVLMKRWKDAKTDNEDVSGVVSFCSL
jgi:hypothetical protein